MPTKPTVQKGVRKGKVVTPPQPSPSRGGRKKGVVSPKIPPPPGEGGKSKPVRKAVSPVAKAPAFTKVPEDKPGAKRLPARKAETVRGVIPLAEGADATRGKGLLERSIIGRYFFLPTDFLLLVWRMLKFAWRNWRQVAIVSIVAILVHYIFGAGLEGVVFMGFLATVFAWDLDGRVSIGAGLACLILIVILQVLIQSGVLLLFEESTETVAVWAYYFLCMGVLKQLVDLVREGRSTDHPTPALPLQGRERKT